jgi:hypothetical protein
MKSMKTMLVAALAVGTLIACSTPVLAQNGGGRRGPMSSDAMITRFQTALGDTNKLTDDEITKVKPVLDDYIKQLTDLRADTTTAQADKAAKRKTITAQTSDSLKAIVTPEQFKVIEPLIQRGGGRRGGGGNGGGTAPAPAPAT